MNSPPTGSFLRIARVSCQLGSLWLSSAWRHRYPWHVAQVRRDSRYSVTNYAEAAKLRLVAVAITTFSLAPAFQVVQPPKSPYERRGLFHATSITVPPQHLDQITALGRPRT